MIIIFVPFTAHKDECVLDGGQGNAGGKDGFSPLTRTVKKKSYAAICVIVIYLCIIAENSSPKHLTSRGLNSNEQETDDLPGSFNTIGFVLSLPFPNFVPNACTK